MQNYEKIFKSESVWKSILTMAIPSLITIMVMVFYNMADMFFIGQLGNTSMVAAVSIVSPVFSLIQGIGTMIGAGGSTLIASAIGEGKPDKARTYSSLCFWTSLLLGVVLIFVLLAIRTPLLLLLGTNADMWDYSMQYMTWLCCGVPFMLLSTGFGSLIRSEGAVREGLIGNLAGTLANIILDPVFILGFGWGVQGAAIATVLGNVIASTFYLVYTLRKAYVISINLKLARKAPLEIFGILALGLPNAVSTILSGFASTFSNRLLSGYGTDAIAAMSAAGKTSMVVGMVMIGITMGCQPLLSYSYGAKDVRRMKELLKDLSILTIGLGAVFAVGGFLLREPLVGLFLKEKDAAAMAASLVIFLVAASPLLGIYYIATNFLQAAKNAPAAIVVSVLRQGALLIPCLYVMNHLFGLRGIALAHTIADLAASLLALVFLVRAYHKFCRDAGAGQESAAAATSHRSEVADTAGVSHSYVM